MAYSALLEFIRKAKQCGASDVAIAQRLGKAGWYGVDVQDALELYRKISKPKKSDSCAASLRMPKPSLAERIIPLKYDSHLIAIAAISFAVGFVAYVLLAY